MTSHTLGIIADTHVPDRRRELHPSVLPIFRDARVSQILHAGDISVPKVLRQLETVAPVRAVRGNRDWFTHEDLPRWRVVELGKKRIGLTHGQGSIWNYLSDRIHFILLGPRNFDYYMQQALKQLPADIDAVVFGHNHSPVNKVLNGIHVFNPGSACCHVFRNRRPSVGLMEVSETSIRGEIVFLD